MKQIQLNIINTKSPLHNKYKMLVDDEDYDLLNQYNWSVKPHGKTFYAVRTNTAKEGVSKIYAHRLLLNISDKKIEVDHVDNDGLNNQKYNLRACSHSLNGKNKRQTNKNTSKYKGVVPNSKNTFKSRITVNGKLITIGNFKDEQNAALAYNKAAIKYYGEYAKLNIIQC